MTVYIPYEAARDAAAAEFGAWTRPTNRKPPSILGKATRTQSPQFGRSIQDSHGVHLLQYPTDVADNPQQGHHILFNISTLDKGKLEKEAITRKEKFTQTENLIKAEINRREAVNLSWNFHGAIQTRSELRKQSVSHLMNTNQIQGYKTPKEYQAARTGGSASKDTTSILMNSPRKKLSTTIALYMPPTVTVKYGSKWGAQTVGMMAQLGHDAIKAFSGENGAEVAKGMLDKIGTGVKHMALGALDTVAPGAKTLAAIETGQIVTDRLELMFEGIERRQFSYEFTFIPRSEVEARIIDEIVFAFKYHMASNLVKGTGGKEYTIPDLFDIKYMYHGGENSFLNKVATCALESMDITYGGEKYQTYPLAGKGGASSSTGQLPGTGTPPQSTKITLGFTELELITKDKVLTGH